MDPAYADRYLNVGFSGGEKKKAEILQLLMLKPALALLDETDSGLDVDAVKTVANGIKLTTTTPMPSSSSPTTPKFWKPAGRLRPRAGRRPHRAHRQRRTGERDHRGSFAALKEDEAK